jgi:hypothetical protein
LIVYLQGPNWDRWFPDSVEAVPPPGGTIASYQLCNSFGEALSASRIANSKYLGKPGAPPNRWSIVGCFSATGPDRTLKIRQVTPLVYYARSVTLPASWRPAHLLDCPNIPWRDGSSIGDESPAFESYEDAASHAAALNRQAWIDRTDEAIVWHILVAKECQAYHSRFEHRCWKPGMGAVSAESSHLFHIFHRATWPVVPADHCDLNDLEAAQQLQPKKRQRNQTMTGRGR